MGIKQISVWLRNAGTLVTMVTVSTFATAIAAPEASASHLVPEIEGEVEVGLGCLEGCLILPDEIGSVVSEIDSTTGEMSRLFVDDISTANTYSNGTTTIEFPAGDGGTTPVGLWYRPADSEENGQLEVGTFTFNFTQMIPMLDIAFFDAESNNSTGVLAVNGVALAPPQFLGSTQLGDSTINTMMLENVQSITLKLGQDFENTTGDGVSFRLHSKIPEPSVVLGLGVVALTGGLGLRKGKNK